MEWRDLAWYGKAPHGIVLHGMAWITRCYYSQPLGYAPAIHLEQLSDSGVGAEHKLDARHGLYFYAQQVLEDGEGSPL